MTLKLPNPKLPIISWNHRLFFLVIFLKTLLNHLNTYNNPFVAFYLMFLSQENILFSIPKLNPPQIKQFDAIHCEQTASTMIYRSNVH